jgi:hypothetical protein
MIYLQPGDIFLSANPWVIGRAINAVQAWWARDCQAVYGHAGIILGTDGTTLEALWRVKSQNIFSAYSGQQVLIGRNKKLSLFQFWRGARQVLSQYGRIYPLHRLALFMIPPLARRINVFDWTVCSELVAQYLYHAGALGYWSGVMPDDLSDMIHNWRDWQIVYEGKLP